MSNLAAILLTFLVNLKVWSDEADSCFNAGAAIGVAFTRLRTAGSLATLLERLWLTLFMGTSGVVASTTEGCI